MFFDNLGVMDITGPILEETHYYPRGLTMAGTSSVAPLKIANNYKFNGIEFHNKGFSDGSGLELYSAAFRDYDPQIGRWLQIDSKTANSPGMSPYLGMYGNPVLYSDPNGDCPVYLAIVAAAVVNGLINVGSQALKGNVHSLGQGLEYFGVGALAGAAYVIPGVGALLAGGIQARGIRLFNI